MKLDPQPRVWLGAQSPGGLALPAAQPTATQLYAPRGVWLDDDCLIVADSGNHRVLIWHELPTGDGQPADVVLGQPDFTSEGPQAGGRGPERGLHLPTGVAVIDGRLVVADAWNHRVLVWDDVPQTTDAPPAYAIGQSNLSQVVENRNGPVAVASLYWPYGIAWIDGIFHVADTGNRRVLGWRGLPEPEQLPALLLGQRAPDVREENRGAAPGPAGFRWPHDLAGNGDVLYVADAGNHRVLAWNPPPAGDGPATGVLGQLDFTTAQEWPYGPQGPQRMRFPYAITLEENLLAVADTANNRILLWESLPREGAGARADRVLGQYDFDANGENRWDLVARDTLCWPYGICLHRGTLAIADSGNNRVMLWTL